MSSNESKKLTEKQKVFCREYLVDFNGTRAAIASGYSKKTAYAVASENLRKPQIQREIQRIADKKLKENGDPIQRIILELQLIAFGDYQDLVQWDENGIEKFVPSKKLGNKSRIVSEISQTTTTSGGSVKIRTYDKIKALELLGKYHKIFSDKIEHSNPDGSMRPVVNVNIPSNGREKE